MNAHTCKAHIVVCNVFDIAEVKLRINSLGVHVQSYSYNVQVSGAFAVTKETAFHAVSTSK